MALKIEFRVSAEQHDLIAKIAAMSGMSPGQWARYSSLQCANHHYTQHIIDESNADLLRKLRVDLSRTANFIAEQVAAKKGGA